jgi:hypothetical protein
MSTNTVRIEFATVATSVGTKAPFKPALRTGNSVMYWPNVSFDTEDQAFDFAAKALKDAYDAANAVAREWNIYEHIA